MIFCEKAPEFTICSQICITISSMKPVLRLELRDWFAAEGIFAAAVLPFSHCRLIQPRKLSSCGLTVETAASALLFLVPYDTGEMPRRNISAYAAPRDYHLYFKACFAKLIPYLEMLYPGAVFGGFADSSPLDERYCAAMAGLGIRGDNGLLIHPEYGSYVLIGAVLSDVAAERFCEEGTYDAAYFDRPIPTCSHCGACQTHCPMKHNPFSVRICLSEVTQTKRLETLCGTEPCACSVRDYEHYIRYFGSAWGCDRCQTVCPHNRAPAVTPIPFFREQCIPYLTQASVAAMDDTAFADRAYAWRKRACIMRNLNLIEADTEVGMPDVPVLEAMIQVVREAGAVMRSAHDVEAQKGAIDEKAGPANFVTVYDVRVQNMLMEALHRILPDAQYFAEEKENDPAILQEGYTFIIDPIDGTTNFIHNYGVSAISVGLLYCGTPVFGVIYDPYREELFEARRGLGAFCNGRRIHVSDRPVEKGVFAVGTAPYYRETLGDATFSMMRSLFDVGADIRRLGSAALDLAAVACGRADGYVELLISPWDYAAGALLVEEAGGIVTDPSGTPMQYAYPSGICAGTAVTHAFLLSACRA